MALAPLLAAAQAAPAAAPRFDILEFEVEGNSVLPATAVEKAVMPFLGPQRNLDDADAARAALEKAYQAAGYLTVFVDLPEQRVDGGVVRLLVLEGRIERLAVTGARYFDQGFIRTQVSELAPGSVPNFNEVQRQLGTVNTGEDRRVQPILRPGRLPGTVEAELQVKDRLPLGGSIEASNAGTANTEPIRTSASLHYDNLWQLGHSLGLTLTTAPLAPSQTTIEVLNYGIPLAGGDNLGLYAVHSNSNVNTLGGTQVLGKGNTLGLRYAATLTASEAGTQTLTLGADYRDVQEQLRQGKDTIAKPLRYLPLQLAYNGYRFDRSRQTQFSSTLTFALRPLLARKIDGCELEDGSIGTDDPFRCKRKGADGGFATLRLDLRHVESFESLGGASLQARLAGQVASQQLTSTEQYAVGGADTVRGYYEGAAVGDHGLLASLEARSPNLALALQRAHPGPALEDLADISLLGFVDAASLFTINPDPGQIRRQPLLGTGAGMRLGTRSGATFEFLVAQAHKAIAGSPLPGRRVHARLSIKY